jgi:hypothetical protein
MNRAMQQFLDQGAQNRIRSGTGVSDVAEQLIYPLRIMGMSARLALQ